MTERLPPLDYYRWRWQKWRANRKVQRMTYIERGLYRELLDECWVEGFIPDDIEKMADICGCPVDVMASAWQTLSKCFELVDGIFINQTLEQERTERDAIRASRSRSGHSGGVAKALKNKEQASNSQANNKQTVASASKCHIEEKRREEKSTEKKTLAVAVAPALPTVAKTKIGFDYKTAIWSGLQQNPALIASWQEAYPGVDMRTEFNKMRAWLMSNPKNRKTNLERFISNWLSKAQDRASLPANKTYAERTQDFKDGQAQKAYASLLDMTEDERKAWGFQ